jgi:hypothetical protein
MEMGKRSWAAREGLWDGTHRASADRLPVPVPSTKPAVLRRQRDQLLLGAVLHPSAVHLRARGWFAVEKQTVLVGGMTLAAKDVGHWTRCQPARTLEKRPNWLQGCKLTELLAKKNQPALERVYTNRPSHLCVCRVGNTPAR